MPRSESALEKELIDKFNEFKTKGSTDKVAKASVFKTLKKQYEALQNWKDRKEEIVAKEAFDKLFKDLKLPSLLLRAVP